VNKIKADSDFLVSHKIKTLIGMTLFVLKASPNVPFTAAVGNQSLRKLS
jgi:hypothetical protein